MSKRFLASLKSAIEFVLHIFKHRPNLSRALTNTSWLFGDKIFRIVVGLIVGAWVARYLGPGKYGVLNYAIALVALFTTPASLGLNGIVVRELITKRELKNEILGTAFVLQVAGGFVALALAVILVNVIKPNDGTAKVLVAIIAAMLILKASETVKYWYESQVQAMRSLIAEGSAFFIVSGAKVYLILTKAPLMAFAWTLLAEAVLGLVALLCMYNYTNSGQLSAWKCSRNMAKYLLGLSWPIVLSSGFVAVSLNIDKILLGGMVTIGELGLYAAANALVVNWFFVPVAIGGSIAPHLTKLYFSDKPMYLHYVCKAYRAFFIGSLVIAALVALSARVIVNILYGAQFRHAGDILSVSIWAVIFISIVSLRGRLLIIEGKQNFVAILVFIGMILNVFMMLWLIPRYGSMGAAYSFTISWALNAILVPLLFRATRKHGLMATGLYKVGK